MGSLAASALLLALRFAGARSKEATGGPRGHASRYRQGPSPMVQYQGKSGSGDTITLNDVTLGRRNRRRAQGQEPGAGWVSNMTPDGQARPPPSIALKGITP